MSAAEEEEWTVEGYLAECDRIMENPPPAPSGFEMVECGATPRHWPIYVAYVDGVYPAQCFLCERDELDRSLSKAKCERTHRRWKSWQVWSWLSTRTYVLGITSSGGGTRFGRCDFCGVTVQHMAPHWRGKRPYLLGLPRETWTCLRRGHRPTMTYYGMCSTCAPCPSCRSTDPKHVGDCEATS